ncbi:beta strand repeat-containing protein [Methylotenera sp. G11]|uniref:beta strand repeat-containing protein n=1 Tax=Methylotenera sp. G11 TaxID=1506585 RepID=UPI0006467E13|nr:cadherin domain-containing protein [Methylotenera sp. G11]
MTIEMIVVNATHQAKVVNLAKGEQMVVAKGDTIRLTKKADISTKRKGNDLVVKDAAGDEYVLKDFYVQSASEEEGQLLSWDDTLGQEKEIISTSSEPINAVATETAANAGNEIAKDTPGQTPAKEDDNDKGVYLPPSQEPPIGTLGGIAGLGFILLSTGGGGHSGRGDGTITPVSVTTTAMDDVGVITGAISNGGVTDDNVPALVIAPPAAGQTPVLLLDGVIVPSVWNSATNSLTPVTPLSDGVHTLAYVLHDAGGNTVAQSNVITFTVDTVAPATPAAPSSYDDNAGAYQNPVSIAAVTDDKTPGVNIGTGYTDTPSLYIDGVLTPSTYNPVTGTLTPNAPVNDGTHNFTFTLTDLAGNVSAQSGPLVIKIDTVAPTQTITINSISADSGTPGDFITNDNNGLTINATLSAALGAGETLQYSNNNGASWNTVAAVNITGSPAVNVSFADAALTSSNTIQFRVSDGTNYGPAASQVITIDTAAPTQTVTINSISADSGIAGDFITNDNDGLIINATLSAALNASETLQYSNGISGWRDVLVTELSGNSATIVDGALTSTSTIKFRVSDGANYSTEKEQLVTVDSSKPLVILAQTFNYDENQIDGALVATVTATDNIGVTAFRFSATGTQTSADGFFSINNSGQISITSAGVLAGVAQNDYEISPNIFNYGIQASDGAQWSVVSAITLSVTDVIETATLSLSQADASVAENSAYTSAAPVLTGTPIGAVTYSLSGADAALFTVDPATGVVSMIARDYEAPADTGADNVYNYTLTVTDADGNSASDAVVVSVTDVIEVSALSLSQADASVAENSAYTSAAPVLTGTPIGAVTYSLSGADAALFTVDPATGVVSMIARDYEAPADTGADNVYNYTLTVTDADGNSASDAVVVSVTDVIEVSALSLSQADASVAENAAYTSAAPVLTGTPIGSVTYSLSGADAALFTVDANTGVVSMIARDYEAPADTGADNVYNYTLTVTDADGNSASDAVVVSVTDVIEVSALSLSQADASVAENSAYTSAAPVLTGTPIGAVTYSLSGADAALFTVDPATGVVSMIARDYEAPADTGADNVYNYTLTVTDADGNSASDAVVVSVTDVIEVSALSLSQADASVAENSAYTSAAPVLTGTPIGAVTYSLSGADAALFTVDANTGVVSMIARDYEAPADTGADNVYNYTLTVTDADGNSASDAVVVSVTDVIETATLSLSQADASVAENSAYTSAAPVLTGTPIGAVTYSLSGADAALFTVDPATGVVSMIARDYEAPADTGADNVYNYTLTVTDADGNSASDAVVVSVTDVIEVSALSLSQADASVAENSAYTSAAPVLTGTPIGAVTYSLSGADAALFTVDPATGVVSMIARDYEAPADTGADNVYNYTLTVTDADGNSASDAVVVSVTDVIEVSALSLSQADASVAENSAYTSAAPVLTGTLIGAVTYSLSGADAALFTVDANTGVVSMIARDYEAPADTGADNVYNYTLTVTDADGNSASDAVVVTVTDVIEVSALSLSQADASVAENSAYTSAAPVLTGTPIGAVTYSLSGADAALFTVDPATGVVSMIARDYEAPADTGADNVYNYTLTVTDADGNSASDAVVVSVTDVIETATLSLSQADASVAENSAYTSAAPVLTGTPIGAVTYSLSGADAALFTVDPATGVVSMIARDYEAPADTGADNVYNYTLTVTDADGNSASDAVVVSVTDVIEVSALSLSQADASVAENSAYTSAAPVLTGTPIGSVTYSLSGADAALFTVDANTGVVSMIARDYEAPADTGADNVYNYTLTVTDADGNSASDAVVVSVTDVIEVSALSLSQADASVAENSAYTSAAPVLTGTPIGAVTYSLSGADAALFTVDPATGVVSMIARDYEAPADTGADNVYNYTLTVTDADGNSASDAVVVSVTDVIEVSALSLSQADASVAENSAYTSAAPVLTGTPIGAVTYSLSGADAALFTVDANTGVVSMIARDYEAPADTGADNVYNYTLTVTDADGNSASDAVVVSVTDVIETATLSLSQADASVAENSAYTSAAPVLTGTPIGAVTYSLSGADAALFTVDPATGVVSMIARDYEAPADTGADNVYNYTLTVTDADGNSASDAVVVSVTDVIEVSALSLSQADASVAENSAYTSAAPVLTGTPIGAVTYSLSGADAALFTVDPATGVVSMIARDYEAPADTGADNVYNYTLTVTDADGNSASDAVVVSVTDVIEVSALSLSQADASVAENSAYTSAAPVLTGTPIGSVTYSLSGADAALFTVDANTGVVSMIARDYEAPADTGADNVYNYTLTVTDADGNSASDAVVVTVTDVIEVSALSLSQADASVAENSAYTSAAPVLTGTPIGAVTYSLSGADAALFTVDANTGVVSMIARDYEAPADTGADNVYNYTLTVTDADGNSASDAVVVSVTDVIETATLSLSQADASVAENSAYTSAAPVLTGTPIGAVTYSLSGADAALFTVDPATGVVSMIARDYEAPADTGADNVYNYTLTVTDADGNSASDAVVVSVTDVIEVSALSLSQADASVAENSAYTSAAPVLTGTPIGAVTYSLSGADAALFTVDPATGVVSMIARDYEAPADTGADNVYNYTLTVTDADGNSASDAVVVSVNNLNDNAPNIADASVALDENIAAGSAVYNVSDSFTSTDLDRDGAAITYSITAGNADGIFEINSATGAITIAVGKTLDYETATSHALTVSATDSSLSDTAVITVNVNNIAEITGISLTSATTTTYGNKFALDYDVVAGHGDSVIYSVTFDDAVNVTGSPQLALNIGGITRYATYNGVGSGTNTLQFAYELKADSVTNGVATGEDFDHNGISIDAGSLSLNSGTIASVANASAAAISHSAVADNANARVDAIDIGTGLLTHGIQVEGNWYFYWDTNGDGTTTVIDQAAHDTIDSLFNYDVNGVQNTTVLNADGMYGTTETYRFAASGSYNGYKLALLTYGIGVDGSGNALFPTVPALGDGGVTGETAVANPAVYNDLTAIWDAFNSGINGSAGIPQGWGDSFWSSTPAVGGHVGVNFSGAYVASEMGVTHNYLALQVFSGTEPTVSAVSITSATGAQNNTLNAGDTVYITVNMSQLVNVTGTPQLAINIGGTTVQANYSSGTGSTALVFAYTIQSGQNDANGIAININSLSLNGGSIKNAGGESAILSHSAVADNAGYLVDTSSPAAPSALDLAAADDTEINNDNITSHTSGLTISGTAEAGSTVQLFDDADNDGVIDGGELLATGTAAAFSTGIDISLAAPGSHRVKAIATDAAGNASAASSALDITISSPVLDATTYNSTSLEMATSGAAGWESFTVNGEQYLAEAANAPGAASKIYHWNGAIFVDYESLAGTTGAGVREIESFTISGEQYLATAGNSSLNFYKWNNSTAQFGAAVQTISTTQYANDLESFTINGEQYLAVANYTDGVINPNTNSAIYKWNGSAFVVDQVIATVGVQDWESFTINGKQYLAQTSHYNGAGTSDSNFMLNSKIYEWNGSSFQFLQDIATKGAYDFESFTVGAKQYLAVTNTRLATNFIQDSAIYEWDANTGLFITTPVDLIQTSSAIDFESFTINGAQYLAVANLFDGVSDYSINSTIYKWNAAKNAGAGGFDVLQNIPTIGAIDWESYTLNGEQYLVVANNSNGSNQNQNSVFYRYNILTDRFDLANQVTLNLGTDEDTALTIAIGSGGTSNSLLGNDGALATSLTLENGIYGIVRDASGFEYGRVDVVGSNVVFTPNATADALAEGDIKDVYFTYNNNLGVTNSAVIRIGGLNNDPTDSNASGGTPVITGAGHSLDLDATTAQTLTLTADMIIGGNVHQNESDNSGNSGLQGLGGYNEFTNGVNGWANGTYTFPTLAANFRNQVVVDGTSADTLQLNDEWNSVAGTVTHGGNTYNVYNSRIGNSQILVDNDVRIQQLNVNLVNTAAGNGGFVINGAVADDLSGWSVANAGDVNGDGRDDVIVGAPGLTGTALGKTYVVYGKGDNTAAVELSDVALGVGGFAITTSQASAKNGYSVSAAGDMNGDGLADLLVGAEGYSGSGESFVVFGKVGVGDTTDNVNLDALGAKGFRIYNAATGDLNGRSVSAAGDVNGDGLADLIVGLPGSNYNAVDAGVGVVVYGKANANDVDVSAAFSGTGGFGISNLVSSDMTGYSVSGAGDVNGDGKADVVISIPGSDFNAVDAGVAYVVLGGSFTGHLNVSELTANNAGFIIKNSLATVNDGIGIDGSISYAVSGAGDVNGDGYADLIVGVQFDDDAGTNTGRSYVVFGKSGFADVDLANVANGIGGFAINAETGADANSWSGHSVSAAGDINGDGLADLIVGAPVRDTSFGVDSGRNYVVYGKASGTAVELSQIVLGNGGFAINGQSAGDHTGQSVSAAGDVNGDGFDDLIVGSDRADVGANIDAGRSYVIFGGTHLTGAAAVDYLGTSGANSLAGTTASEIFVAGDGNDTITGNGGADVMYGGRGDDTFVINASNIKALRENLGDIGSDNIDQLARIDGGTGIDTISLLGGSGITLDFTAIKNQAASTPDGGSRIDSIERIDITGSGDNTLRLNVKDVLDMSGMNLFNNANGWVGAALAAGGVDGNGNPINPEQRHQLVIDGDANDAVISSGWGASVGTVTNGGQTYAVYNATGVAAQLLVDTDILSNVNTSIL